MAARNAAPATSTRVRLNQIAVPSRSTAIWFSRTLVLVAGAAFLAATLPHFAYHLTTTDSFSTGDNLASLGGFAVEVVVVIAAMVAVSRDSAIGD